MIRENGREDLLKTIYYNQKFRFRFYFGSNIQTLHSFPEAILISDSYFFIHPSQMHGECGSCPGWSWGQGGHSTLSQTNSKYLDYLLISSLFQSSATVRRDSNGIFYCI